MGLSNIYKKFITRKEFFPFIGLIILIVVCSILSPHFLTVENLSNILTQGSIIAVIAVGETFVILTGGIDLSPGSLIALTGAMAAILSTTFGLAVPLAMLGGLICGGLAGALSGLLVTRVKIPSFVATLAMMAAARGAALILTGGRPVSGLPSSFTLIDEKIGPFSGLVIIMIAIYLIGHVILTRTKLGRYIFALGGSELSARYLGVDADRIKLFVFTFAGLCGAIGGLMMDARLASSYPNVAEGYELDAIAASVLGGVSFAGGKGSLVGTFMGAIIMTIIGNILVLLRVSAFYQYLARGIILALAAFSLSRGKRFAK